MAPLPVLLLVLMQASWSLLGQRQGPVNRKKTGRRDVEQVAVPSTTRKGGNGWLGKTMIKKWSNHIFWEKKMGVSGLETMLPCFLVDLFFLPVDLSRNHGTKAYFFWVLPKPMGRLTCGAQKVPTHWKAQILPGSHPHLDNATRVGCEVQ